jgi:hypothetical protein
VLSGLVEEVVAAEPVSRQTATAELGRRAGHGKQTLDVDSFERSPDLPEVHPRSTPTALLGMSTRIGPTVMA